MFLLVNADPHREGSRVVFGTQMLLSLVATGWWGLVILDWSEIDRDSGWQHTIWASWYLVSQFLLILLSCREVRHIFSFVCLSSL